MRERINRLAKGIVDLEIPELRISPEQIEERVNADEVTIKEISIADVNGLHIKGLVYSSNIRVKVKNSAFGGSRNHIGYEVDSNHLTQGDTIEGAFFFVTAGGERKVPYEFHVDLGVSGRTLGGLKTPEDFGEIAKKDLDTALRLFEYQDFVEAPFMQDMHIRTLYDGLKGHAGRQNLLEEFLVALKLKEPVELEFDTDFRSYEGLIRPLEETLEVTGSTWGYVRFDVEADGDFIELPKKSFTTADFKEGVCRVPYVINPARLHRGKNMGALTISTVRSEDRLRIEVWGQEEDGAGSLSRRQGELARYLSLRLEYETGMYEDRLLLNQMRQELERMRQTAGETLLCQLLQSELCLMEGQKERAITILEGCRVEVTDKRLDSQDMYCFFQYLMYQIQKKDGQRETLVRLIRKYLSEERHFYLFFLWMKLEPSMAENPAELLDRFKELFRKGCRSPFLYVQAFKLYEREPLLLKKVENFELQVLLFAARRELIEQELALKVAELAGVAKHYHKLYYRILVMLHETYPEKALLGAVCCMLIKGDCRESVYFHWYQEALKQGISLTRLYEYFLYSLPKDYPYLLPKEVLLYFSYEKEIDDESRSVLYMNILKYMKPEAALYKQYERDIERFTMEQLLQSRINRRLVVLYQHMIYREMIDERVARVLPSILKSYRVRLKNPNMRYVVVCYEELKGEDAFPIRDGVAYVPLFLEHTVLLFQDDYGNRYANIPYRKLPAMEKTDIRELEEQCYDIYPSHPMLRLQECGEIVEAGIRDDADVVTLRRASADLNLHPLYQRKILSGVIQYYQDRMDADLEHVGGEVDYLMDLDIRRFSRKERVGICETLISREYIREAFEIIREYGCEGIRSSRLLKLCTRMILQNLFDQDDILLNLACQMFSEGKYDSVVLDYLCEHFNGSTKLMFKVLNQGIREHVDTYDMPERLLAQMIFTGETGRIDQVFDWYASGRKTSENIVKAYFTLKSVDYFLKDQPTGDKVFAWLEGALHSTQDKSRVPTIYLLALTRYYSERPALDEERAALCKAMVELLLAEGRVFPYFRKLGKLIPMPDSIMDKVMVEYKGSKDACPELQVRILPEEEDYHNEAMRRVYPGIYVHQKVLFDGEIMEYQIYESRGGERVLMKEGSVMCEPDDGRAKNSRFAALNEMGLCLTLKEGAIKDKMKKYVTDSAMMEELFLLM